MTFSGNFSCTCAAGFEGHLCENDTDECASQPCFNGGTCQDQLNSFTCDCPVGFIGNQCEANIVECLSNPCENGGTCVESVGLAGYTCSCPTGYQGKFYFRQISHEELWVGLSSAIQIASFETLLRNMVESFETEIKMSQSQCRSCTFRVVVVIDSCYY